MPINSAFLHCIWSNQKSRLNLTHACGNFGLLLFTDKHYVGPMGGFGMRYRMEGHIALESVGECK